MSTFHRYPYDSNTNDHAADGCMMAFSIGAGGIVALVAACVVMEVLFRIWGAGF